MSAVWMRLGAELRKRRRAWLGLALLTGIFGGAVVAAATGAARTGSVVDRFLAEKRPPDIFLAPLFGIQELDPARVEALRFERLMTLPSVEGGAHTFLFPSTVENLEVSASDDPALGRRLFSSNLIEGRLPDPRRADEAVANSVAARTLGLKAGDLLRVDFLNIVPGIPGDDREPGPGPSVQLRITGITADIGDFAAIAGPSLGATPAFLERYRSQMEGIELSMLRLRNGTASYDAFRKELEGLTGGETVFYVEAGTWEEARRSFRLQAVSLWILAGVLAFVTVLVLSQTIARQTFLDSGEHPTLRALGLSRGELFALGMARTALVGVFGAAVAVIAAAAASPLAPFGNARLADPDPAFSVPAVPLALGFSGVLLSVLALAVLPAWRASRVTAAGAGTAGDTSAVRPAHVVEAASRAARGAVAGIGIRMALEPGRGRTAVPVRTTISATAVALVALTAALVVGTSLDRLTRTPRLYGWNWDVAVISERFADPMVRAELTGVEGISDASFGPEGGTILVNGTPVEPYGLSVGASVHPPILEGRAPAAPNEMLVARKTLQAVGAGIGDEVTVGVQGTPVTTPFRIVGVTVLPLASDVSTLGEGAWIPVEDLGRVFGQEIPMDRALVRFAPGADRPALTRALEERFGTVEGPHAPGTVVDFGRVSNMPNVLAGIVGLLAVGTLTHGLVTTVRRRRRDLAVLKTLGLDRGQVRRAVAWQASAIATLALVIAVPLGVIAGRGIWTLFADQTGFVAEPAVEGSMIALALPAGLLVANVIATLPARSAARTHPAIVLRSE